MPLAPLVISVTAVPASAVTDRVMETPASNPANPSGDRLGVAPPRLAMRLAQRKFRHGQCAPSGNHIPRSMLYTDPNSVRMGGDRNASSKALSIVKVNRFLLLRGLPLVWAYELN